MEIIQAVTVIHSFEIDMTGEVIFAFRYAAK
jgi:hypothetical protein